MKSFNKRFQQSKVYNQIYANHIKRNRSVHNEDIKASGKDFIFCKESILFYHNFSFNTSNKENNFKTKSVWIIVHGLSNHWLS